MIGHFESEVEAHVVGLVQKLCRIPSPLGQERRHAEFAAETLANLGFEVELQPLVGDLVNVVAISRGDPGYRSIMLNGHLDAPGPYGTWTSDPFDPWLEDGRIYGAGIQDMKGGLASLIVGAAGACAALERERGDVIVTLFGYHDTIGLGGKYFLESCPWKIDVAINAEPTGLAIQTFHGGAWAWEIVACGQTRHISRMEDSVDAIQGLVRIVDRIQNCLTYDSDPAHDFLPRLVVGRLQGGEASCFTAQTCTATGDVRFLPTMSIDGLKDDFNRAIGEVCSEVTGLSASVRTVAQQWPYEISSDNPVLEVIADAHHAITGAPVAYTGGLPGGAYITDAADMVRHGIPTVIYGPGTWNTEEDEFIEVEELVTAARVYSAAIREVVSGCRAS